MKLFPLAYTCRLYREVAQFDDAYQTVRRAFGRDPDLASVDQQDALMRFLNDWRCRISEENFPALKARLRNWAVSWIQSLPAPDRDIRSLTPAERTEVGASYAELLKLGAGLRLQHTAAAKTLHALRPETLPIWDSAIRDEFERKVPKRRAPGQCYSDFLRHVANELDELEQDAKRLEYSLADVPRLVERQGNPLVKLVDEFYWITITTRHTIPHRDELTKWLSWCPPL